MLVKYSRFVVNSAAERTYHTAHIMPFITVHTTRFYFQTHGPATTQSPALVLLHGSGGDSSVWYAQVNALAHAQRIVELDLPGHGQSEGTPAASADDYADWLKLMLEALELPACVLAGHSMGGIIAQQFARRFPDRLRALILVATGLRFAISDAYLAVLSRDFNAACDFSCRQAYAVAPPDTVRARGLAMLRRNGPAVLERDLSLCAGFDSTAWAHTLTMPCLILCGAHDTITPCALSQQLADTITGSILRCIEGAGHMIMQEQPDVVNREISQFIAAYTCSGRTTPPSTPH